MNRTAAAARCAKSAARARMTSVETLRLRDGRALCVRRWCGSGENPLVLLHGLLDSSEGWSPLGERLGAVAFDLPGFGHSDPPAHGSIAGYADDLTEGLEKLGIKRMTLVGHSLGGAVAATLAERLRERVTGLILLAPAGFGRLRLAEIAWIPGVRQGMELALPMLLSSRLAVTAAYVTMVSNGKQPDPELIERLTSRSRFLVDGVREATRSMIAAGRSPDVFERRAVGYQGPVHAVWGDRDLLVPSAHHHGVLAAFPQARVQIWRGMGHHPLRERPEELIEIVEGAISERQARRRTVSHRLADAA
jgi:pimeloyl-ACP methyl ester carboxylesterase